MAEFIELVSSRESIVALKPEQQTFTLRYILMGVEDDEDADNLIQTALQDMQTIRGQPFENYRKMYMGCGNWEIEINYGHRKTGQITLNFDTGTHKQKVTQAAERTNGSGDPIPGYTYYPGVDPESGEDLDEIDYKGAVGIKKHNGETKVEGVEIEQEEFVFTIVNDFGPGMTLDEDMVALIEGAAWHVNSDEIDVTIANIDFHFDPGELLCQGTTGEQGSGGDVLDGDPTGGGDWNGKLTIKFGVHRNQEDVTIAGIEHVDSKGWDYVEVIYEEAVSDSQLLPRAVQVNVNAMYPEAELTPLFALVSPPEDDEPMETDD